MSEFKCVKCGVVYSWKFFNNNWNGDRCKGCAKEKSARVYAKKRGALCPEYDKAQGRALYAAAVKKDAGVKLIIPLRRGGVFSNENLHIVEKKTKACV